MASTGDKLNINLKLTKEPNTVTDNSYTGEYTGGYITADTFPVEDYGKYVTNYVPINGINDEGIQWKIFHADTEDNNIYLISDTYVPLKNEAGTKNYISTKSNIGTKYGVVTYWTDDYYNGTMDVVGNIATKWLKQYTNKGYTATNAETSGKMIAYLLDINEWNGFKDNGYANYAVGGATIELFVDSYNKTHESKTIEIQVANSDGYQIRWNDGSFGNYIDGLEGSLYIVSAPADGSVSRYVASVSWKF